MRRTPSPSIRTVFAIAPFVWTAVTACSGNPEAVTTASLAQGTDPLALSGSWTRSFSPRADAEQTATYDFSPTQVHYTLTGPLTSADYVVHKDWYNEAQGRIVGHSDDGTLYVLLLRDVSESNLTLYKQTVDSLNAGIELQIPPADTQENHGWNVYAKQGANQ